MRKPTKVLGGVALVVALAAPALALYQVVYDRFDPATETGKVVIQIEATLYQEIRYRDMDGSKSFTAPDQQIAVSYIRREAGITPPGN